MTKISLDEDVAFIENNSVTYGIVIGIDHSKDIYSILISPGTVVKRSRKSLKKCWLTNP